MLSYDILIVGGGPGGLSAALYSARAGYSVLVIDPMGTGGQLLYIDEIENYPGFDKISGYELSSKMENQCSALGVRFEFMEAEKIEKKANKFYITTDSEEIEAKVVIIATGAKHKHLGVPGEEEYIGRGVSYCATCDGPFFKGKRTVVVGGGDTALTDALYLSKLCEKVTIVHRRTEFRGQKILQDRIKAKENIKTELGKNVSKIIGDANKVTSVLLTDGTAIETDSIFIFVGTEPNSSIVSDLVIRDKGYIVTNERMETSLSGLYAVGDVRTTPFRQVVTAASDGATAAHYLDEYIQSLN